MTDNLDDIVGTFSGCLLHEPDVVLSLLRFGPQVFSLNEARLSLHFLHQGSLITIFNDLHRRVEVRLRLVVSRWVVQGVLSRRIHSFGDARVSRDFSFLVTFDYVCNFSVVVVRLKDDLHLVEF